MGIISGQRAINAVIGGGLSSSGLQTFLGTASNAGSFAQALGLRASARSVIQNQAALNVVCASALGLDRLTVTPTSMRVLLDSQAARKFIGTSGTAFDCFNASSAAMARYLAGLAGLEPLDVTDMTSVAASSSQMAAIAGSSAAMAVAAASTVAMNAFRANTVSKMALFNSDTALAAIVANSIALTSLRGAGTSYAIYNCLATSTTQTITGPSAAGSYILLGSSTAGDSIPGTGTLATRRSGSAVTVSGLNFPTTVGTEGATTPFAIPLVTPFTLTQTSSGGYVYFGMLRCDTMTA